MSDEIKAAAERLRRCRLGGHDWDVVADVYAEKLCTVELGQLNKFAESLISNDEDTLATAYLAEHPEPDNREICKCCGQRIIKRAEPGVVP